MMDNFQIIVLIIIIAIVFIIILGTIVYVLNITHQNKVIDKQLKTVQDVYDTASRVSDAIHDDEDGEEEKHEEDDDEEEDQEHRRRPRYKRMPINVPTRGMEKYRQLGVLTSVSGPKEILPLYGRRTYVRSANWNYYTITNRRHRMRVAVVYKNKDCFDNYGCHEISNDDVIEVPAYDMDFRVLLYRNRAPRYIPYID